MRHLGHQPNNGRFPLLRNYSRLDKEVDQVCQWIGKGWSREAQESRREAVQCGGGYPRVQTFDTQILVLGVHVCLCLSLSLSLLATRHESTRGISELHVPL